MLHFHVIGDVCKIDFGSYIQLVKQQRFGMAADSSYKLPASVFLTNMTFLMEKTKIYESISS